MNKIIHLQRSNFLARLTYAAASKIDFTIDQPGEISVGGALKLTFSSPTSISQLKTVIRSRALKEKLNAAFKDSFGQNSHIRGVKLFIGKNKGEPKTVYLVATKALYDERLMVFSPALTGDDHALSRAHSKALAKSNSFGATALKIIAAHIKGLDASVLIDEGETGHFKLRPDPDQSIIFDHRVVNDIAFRAEVGQAPTLRGNYLRVPSWGTVAGTLCGLLLDDMRDGI